MSDNTAATTTRRHANRDQKIQMQADGEKSAFLEAVGESLASGTFRKLTLGKYRGSRAPARATGTRVELKGVIHLRITTRQGTQEFTQNLTPDAALPRLGELIGGDYLSATLHTTASDVTLVYSRKGVPRLTRGKPTMTEAQSLAHNRTKAYLVDTAAPFLDKLGVTHVVGTTGERQVKPSMYGKFRQICRFVEIVDQLVATSALRNAESPRVVDIGSGKGYLTFALHDHLSRGLGKQPRTLGLEANAGLVDQCTKIAAACALAGLEFEATRADAWAARRAAGDGDAIDILIALHACDTATDDAIHLGITAHASLIVTAPCCQHEIAPQLVEAGSDLDGLLKYGLLKQRHADLVTDAARALLLESQGYDVRVIEFVSTEHSAKNLMIAAVRSAEVDRSAAAEQYRRLAASAGFGRHRLAELLGWG